MIFSKIKSMLVEEDGPQKPKEQSKPASSAQAPASQPTAAQSQTSSALPPITAPANNEYVDALRKGVKGRPTPFTALLDAADKMAGIIPDSTMRLKAAFATVASDGRGVREVVGAIDVHVADLDAQRVQFQRAIETKKSQTLSALQTEKSTLQTNNASTTAAIEALQRQISDMHNAIARNTARLHEVELGLNTENAKFASAEAQFEAAVSLVRQELEGHRAAISSSLS